jgi:hypothetical protein
MRKPPSATRDPLIRNCPFAFRCQQTWEGLAPTDDPARRHCGDCQRDVLLCLTDDDLRRALLGNSCVAIPVELREQPAYLGQGPYYVGEPRPPYLGWNPADASPRRRPTRVTPRPRGQ